MTDPIKVIGYPVTFVFTDTESEPVRVVVDRCPAIDDRVELREPLCGNYRVARVDGEIVALEWAYDD